jgi:hypothetical protein
MPEFALVPLHFPDLKIKKQIPSPQAAEDRTLKVGMTLGKLRNSGLR